MDLTKIDFNVVFREAKIQRRLTDEKIEKIVLYINGEISYEDIELNEEVFFYINTDRFLSIINAHYNNLILDKNQFIRVMKLYFSLNQDENFVGIARDLIYIGYKRLFEFAEENKEFYDEVMDKETSIITLVKGAERLFNLLIPEERILGPNHLCSIVDKYEDYDEKYIKNLMNVFGMYTVEEVIKKHGNTEEKSLCILATAPFLKEENQDEVKEKVLEAVSIIADDHYIEPIKFEPYNSSHQHSLKSEEKSALLELIDTGENWDKNIKIIKDSVSNVFFRDETSFKTLSKYIKKQDDNIEFVQRFKKVLFYLYIDIDTYIFDSSCKFKSRRDIGEFKERLKKYPYLTNELFEYVLTPNLKFFNFRDEFTFFPELVRNFDIEFLIEQLNYQSEYFYMRGIYLLSKFSGEEKINIEKEKLKEKILDDLFYKIALNKEAADTLKSYVFGKIHEVDITKVLAKKIKEIGKYNYYCLFDEQEQKRLIYIILNSKNINLIQILPKYFYNSPYEKQDNPCMFYLEFLIDSVIELNINIKEFLRALLEYFSISSKTQFDSAEYRYFIKSFAALEYLNKKGIACIELASTFPIKLKNLLIDSISIDSKEVDTKLALLLVDYLGIKNSFVIDELKKLEGKTLKEVENKIYDEIHKYNKKKELLSVEVLCHYKSDEQKLKDIYIDLKEPKSRDIIARTIKIDLDELL